ncbi:YdcF family protein [Aquibacillus koreensis]|uniref:YdcF family protein n=1 Tax=Aquibacillus koreensis TaxID=279446 RepID=A0A9X3WM56_9BACI|nr:YdcF family protein [Aquibacillus koreensis]MCT2535462.1 YdcF family protein [Aquibacillus koreensis]MDC3422297.1 YdcF family protein [Aquibacillus koreensis]
MSEKRTNLLFIVIALIIVLLLILFGSSFGVLFITANILTVAVIFLLKNHYRKTRDRKYKFFTRLLATIYGLFLLSFILVESFILYELAEGEKIDPETIDFVIILGAGLQGEKPSKTLETRLIAGSEFLLENNEIPVVVSGGQGPGESITEAEAMGDYLKQKGVAEDRIYYEKLSTTTFENLTNAKQLIEQVGVKDPTVLIVTSDYHIVRAKMIGKETGLNSYGLGGESPLFVKINYFIREYFAIVKTWFVHLI